MHLFGHIRNVSTEDWNGVNLSLVANELVLAGHGNKPVATSSSSSSSTR